MLGGQELAMLSTLLSEQHRKYHNINHIHQCLVELEGTAYLTKKQAEYVHDALWYHDAIYNPYSKRNEIDSASLAEEFYNPASVVAAIRYTARHVEQIDWEVEADPVNHIVYQTVLDIDLSGFGKDRMVFANNGMNIRDEYYNTPLRQFLEGRQRFYELMLKRPSLYYTNHFQTLYHARSQDNIRWELEWIERALNDDIRVWAHEMKRTQEPFFR